MGMPCSHHLAREACGTQHGRTLSNIRVALLDEINETRTFPELKSQELLLLDKMVFVSVKG